MAACSRRVARRVVGIISITPFVLVMVLIVLHIGIDPAQVLVDVRAARRVVHMDLRSRHGRPVRVSRPGEQPHRLDVGGLVHREPVLDPRREDDEVAGRRVQADPRVVHVANVCASAGRRGARIRDCERGDEGERAAPCPASLGAAHRNSRCRR